MLALATFDARAGLLSCTFTEPFFTISFDPATGEVTRISPDDAGPHGHEFEVTTVATGAQIVRDDSYREHPTAQLRTAGEVLMVITFSGKGNDGMSDRVYPMEGIWGTEPRGNNVGGCATEKAPGFELYELYDELGVSY